MERQLLQAWNANAAAWTAAVRERAIPSRIAGTDQAIVDAVRAVRPARVLDVGCGEGWLARRLHAETGCAVIGIDGSAPLIAAARAADPDGSYRLLSYEAAIAQPAALGRPTMWRCATSRCSAKPWHRCSAFWRARSRLSASC